MLTQAELKQLLHYDPETGLFTWICRKCGVTVGSQAGAIHHEGYIIIKLNRKQYPAHRLAWLFIYGKFPTDEIDHINRVRADNRISNLRAVTPQQNQFNLTKRKNTTSKYIGVSWNNRLQKYISQIQVNKQKIYLGMYDSEQDAHAAYVQKKAELHII